MRGYRHCCQKSTDIQQFASTYRVVFITSRTYAMMLVCLSVTEVHWRIVGTFVVGS